MENENKLITEKLSREVHREVKQSYPVWMGQKKKHVKFYEYFDMVVRRGLSSIRKSFK
jgi:hypothetical protein